MQEKALDRRKLYSCTECRTPKYINELVAIDGEFVCRYCLHIEKEKKK